MILPTNRSRQNAAPKQLIGITIDRKTMLGKRML
jgi:hypothetical protein